MWKHKFELELIFSDAQMNVIHMAYQKTRKSGFNGTLEEYIETLAQVGVCTTLLEMAKNA